MRLMVGQSGDGTAVYGIVDHQAISLIAKDPDISADLDTVIKAGARGLAHVAALLLGAPGL